MSEQVENLVDHLTVQDSQRLLKKPIFGDPIHIECLRLLELDTQIRDLRARILSSFKIQWRLTEFIPAHEDGEVKLKEKLAGLKSLEEWMRK